MSVSYDTRRAFAAIALFAPFIKVSNGCLEKSSTRT